MNKYGFFGQGIIFVGLKTITMNLDPHKIPVSVYAVGLIILGLIGTGFLFLYVYFNNFFNRYDDFRIVICTFAITIPVMLYNVFLINPLLEEDSKNEAEELLLLIGMSAIITFAILFFSVLLGYYFTIRAKWGVGIVLILEVLFTVLSFLLQRAVKKETKSQTMNGANAVSAE